MIDKMFQLAVLTLIVVFPTLPAVGEEKTAEDGFVFIFDGKTLKGWEATPAENAPAWTVEDGMIVGDGDKGIGYLAFEKDDIADLEFKLSYRFPGNGNSGVSIRVRKDETGRRAFRSYHADLGHVGIGKQVLGAWDFHTPGRREHACFRGDRLVIDKNDNPTVTKIEGAVTLDDIHKGGWNDLHIIAKGNNFKFFINGKPASEFTEHLPMEKRLKKGKILLQLHDPGMIVQYKNIRLKVLSKGDAATPADAPSAAKNTISRPRIIATTDGEIDDQCSMVRSTLR